MEYKTHRLSKPKIVITVDSECPYVTVMAILIIFHLIHLRMLSIGRREGIYNLRYYAYC